MGSTSAIFRAAAPGLGRLASALSGDGAFEQAKNKQIKFESALANQLASQQAHAATADLNKAKTAAEEAATAARAPDVIQRNAMVSNGIPLDEESAISEFLRSGSLGGKYTTPEDGVGPVAPEPAWAKDLGNLARSIGAMQNAVTLGDKNSENVAKATQIGRETSLGDQVLRGKLDPTLFAQAQYAAKGSAPFHFNEYGVGNNLTGKVDATGAPAQAFGKFRQSTTDENVAQTGSAKASAANSYASAGQHNAQTKKINQDIADGVKTGQIQVITDNDGNVSLLNKVTGIARPATTAEGAQFVGKGPKQKDIPATVNAKIIEGRQGLQNIESAIAAIEKDPGALGFSNAIPGAQTVKQIWASDADVGTRAKVANIGSLKLHDRSGAAVSASEFPRLAPFIPSASDSPKAAVAKLREMKKIAEEELGLFSETYNEDNGYKSSKILQRRSTDAQPAQTPGGFKYLGTE